MSRHENGSDWPPYYRLPWIGLGTPYSESLHSYVQRLAYLHCVLPSELYKTLLRPRLAARGYRSTIPGFVSTSFPHRISAEGIRSRLMTEVLADATGQPEIEYGGMHSVTCLLDTRFMVHRWERYCHRCYAGDNYMLYAPILWDFDVVEACPLHGTILTRHICRDRPAGTIGKRERLLSGVCVRCGSIGMRCDDGAEVAASSGQLATAKGVGAVVAAATAGMEFSKEMLLDGVLQCCKQHGGDRAVAQALRISRHYLASVCMGVVAPRLPLLMAIAAQCDTSLLCLFQGKAERVEDPSPMPGPQLMACVRGSAWNKTGLSIKAKNS